MKYSPLTTTMIRAAQTAGHTLIDMQRSRKTAIVTTKGKHDFATEADLAAQKVIAETLEKVFPTIPLVAEESEAPTIPLDGTFFTIDALDNSLPYRNQFLGGWGNILCYIQEFQPKAAVIFLPGEKELIVAEAGRGCFLNDQPCKIVYDEPFEQAVIGLEIGPWLNEHCWRAVITPLSSHTGMTKSCESVVGVDVLRGRLALWGFVRGTHSHAGGIWDFAAPALAIQEAGGVAFTPRGEALRFDDVHMHDEGVFYAANKSIANQVLDLTKDW